MATAAQFLKKIERTLSGLADSQRKNDAGIVRVELAQKANDEQVQVMIQSSQEALARMQALEESNQEALERLIRIEAKIHTPISPARKKTGKVAANDRRS